MKAKQLMISAMTGLVLISGMTTSAFADDKWLGNRGSNWLEHVQSTKSRAEVRAEVEQARKDGTLRVSNSADYPQPPATANTRTRAEVRAEAVQANRNGDPAFDSIYFGS
ncbi:DUF4148 domain-containing protein [Noviherbaspirillum sp. CPCC 100848]|uniref:DUF4148 domain-containing protein n=1 Tax=Noviherbaspirillum album TaxID=3080276 RepID=A0ABU6J3C6_9BURK|nr:DUF4148 domain-containing protein [Noviherbaspirillum sp. CPCC 100848]MEC4718114.1 DUF4148 domain-containing protein [Noviherbaspirillum sp. CPCC 100848]